MEELMENIEAELSVLQTTLESSWTFLLRLRKHTREVGPRTLEENVLKHMSLCMVILKTKMEAKRNSHEFLGILQAVDNDDQWVASIYNMIIINCFNFKPFCVYLIFMSNLTVKSLNMSCKNFGILVGNIYKSKKLVNILGINRPGHVHNVMVRLYFRAYISTLALYYLIK